MSATGQGVRIRGRTAGVRIIRALAPRVARLPGAGIILMVRCYQATVAPLLIGSCKFCPTCSEYMIEAVQKHGFVRGVALGLRRLLRCHPFTPGGIDPVP